MSQSHTTEAFAGTESLPWIMNDKTPMATSLRKRDRGF